MSTDVPPEVMEGARLFNEQDYFEAHEKWEEHWGKGDPVERAATLGLIKAAVALEHLRNGNVRGFEWQADRAVKLLQEGKQRWPRLRLDALAEALESVGAQCRYHGHVSEDEYPRLPLP